MTRRLLRSFFVLAVVFATSLVALHAATPARAATLSSGCAAVNGQSYALSGSGALSLLSGYEYFNGGETINAKLSSSNASQSITLYLFDFGGVAKQASGTSSASVGVPVTTLYTPIVVITNTGSYMLTISCGLGGPGIPTGFVLRTVTCDTAVFDSPDGTPVGSNKITNGQKWFMNSTAKAGKTRSWTEVFLGGTSTAYIWTSCVK